MAIEFETTEVIEASPDLIFEALLDLDGAEEWMPNLVRMEPLTEGPPRVGSEWRETRKMFGKEAREQFELTALDPPRRLELRVDGTKGTTGRGEFHFRYDLERAPEGTQVTLSSRIDGMGAIAGFFGKLFVRAYRKSCAKDLVALKEHLEGRVR